MILVNTSCEYLINWNKAQQNHVYILWETLYAVYILSPIIPGLAPLPLTAAAMLRDHSDKREAWSTWK